MRGADVTQESLFTVAKLADFVPASHPLRHCSPLTLTNPAAPGTLGRYDGLPSSRKTPTHHVSRAQLFLCRAGS